jgi:microcystin-dependent protein
MSEPFFGEIKTVGFNFAPRSWAFCSGGLLSISQNNALFALLGTTYGGDGRTNFKLPELRGRVPMSFGSGPGLTSYRLGEVGGYEKIPLDVVNLPAHTHIATVISTEGGGSEAQVEATTDDGDSDKPENGSYLAGLKSQGLSNDKVYKKTPTEGSTVLLGGVSGGGSAGKVTVTNANTGSGNAVYNVQPFLALNYIIALNGIFPSRS